MQHFFHFSRPEEQVLVALLALEETETVLVADHGATDQVELFDYAQITAPVAHDLAVAFHRRDAAGKGLDFAFGDAKLFGQSGFFQRYAGLNEHVEYEFPARQRMFVAPGFARQMGILPAARTAPVCSGFFRFFHLKNILSWARIAPSSAQMAELVDAPASGAGG